MSTLNARWSIELITVLFELIRNWTIRCFCSILMLNRWPMFLFWCVGWIFDVTRDYNKAFAIIGCMAFVSASLMVVLTFVTRCHRKSVTKDIEFPPSDNGAFKSTDIWRLNVASNNAHVFTFRLCVCIRMHVGMADQRHSGSAFVIVREANHSFPCFWNADDYVHYRPHSTIRIATPILIRSIIIFL